MTGYHSFWRKRLMRLSVKISLLLSLFVTANLALADSTAGLAALNQITNGAAVGVGTANGVKVTGLSAEQAFFRGIGIPVATTAEAAFSASRLAGLATGALRAGTAIGIATLVLPWLFDQGVKQCAAYGYCKPSTTTSPALGAWSGARALTYSSPQDACNSWIAVRNADSPHNYTSATISEVSPTSYGCVLNADDGTSLTAQSTNLTNSPSCAAGSTLSNGMCVSTGADVAAADADITSALQAHLNAEYADNLALYNKMRAANIQVYQDSDTVTLSGVATKPAPVVTTTQVANADGTSSTKVVNSQTVVTPTQVGTNFADSKLTYPATTTTTTTITNNTTGAVTTYNDTTTADATEIPTDYAREVTQGKILAQLDGSLVTTAPVDQTSLVAADVASDTAQSATQFNAIPAAFESDKLNWFSWVWTPPIGVCKPSTGTVHGWSITWDYCPTINDIRDALGWLFALFAAWSTYGLIFREKS